MNTLDRADAATDRDDHDVHDDPTRDRENTRYPDTADPLPDAADHDTETRPLPADTFTPGTADGRPTRTDTGTGTDHEPQPWEFPARTRV